MNPILDAFGSLVFSDEIMREMIPGEAYRAMREAARSGKRMTAEVASAVAAAMKEWAVAKGATHFTHWFQPMTGITAEKHECFLKPADGRAILEFSGKELIQGEPDASSFPSGGLRSTFEARGYTTWDPTSYAFVKDGVLCIPTAFCSYGGEALDKKTPLLRSMEALNREAVSVLKLLGRQDVSSVNAAVGAEQEYFLIDRALYLKRKDLIYTGRTLFGARPPKGQELDDHYFGAIRPRVAAFMKELDSELWKLGVYARTEHKEVAPGQHELAPIFTTVNIAADHNQITMELLQKIAEKHGMVCLLHEKPFAGVNGSGKHNNWSLLTDTGENLLESGETPEKNAQFLLFLSAVVKAVDEYQDLLRLCVASAANDCRLGANEAPPAIVSMHLGEELTRVLVSLERGEDYASAEKKQFKVGVHAMPRFAKDSTDRNRTSPFAFTGNKFEFRMVGSSASISEANTFLNTAVAHELKEAAALLAGQENLDEAIHRYVASVVREHGRILFNGNGYEDAWRQEAKKRGLLNMPATPDCAGCFLSEKNRALFEEERVLSAVELHSRYEMMLEEYCKIRRIEALTMTDMVHRDYLPAVSSYAGALLERACRQKELGLSGDSYEADNGKKLLVLEKEVMEETEALEQSLVREGEIVSLQERANFHKDTVFAQMNALRATVDAMETMTDGKYWPCPTYGELLFSVR